ncbi:MAG: hypothetical protein ACXWEG_12525, partial [Actinomycetota bacterium]
VVAVAVGASLVVVALASAIKTVVLPRASSSIVTRWVFLVVQHLFGVLARPSMSLGKRDRRLAWYSPLGLVATLAAWLTLTLAGFTLVFWGVEDLSMRAAFDESGSALLTLGLSRPGSLAGVSLAFTEAAIGLFLLALLITYLPSIYAAFARRELGVTALEVRAGSPPSGREMIWRFWALQRMEHLNGVWVEWERWFVDVEETHTSLPAVAFFRSPQPDHHWVTAAGAVLDGAALAVSTVDIERDVEAEFCLRAGYLCLRRIADFYNFAHDADPRPEDPISVTRSEWEEAVASLEGAGVPLKADRDQAWRDFAGWRVNYDAVLLALANLTSAPPAPWSSDRSGARQMRPRLFGGAVELPRDDPR